MQPIATLLADELVVPARVPDGPPSERRSFALEVDDAPEVLERVMAHLRRRRCRVTDVAFAASLVPGEQAHLVVTIEAAHERAHLVESWLGGIHAVHSVESIRG